MNEDYFEQLLDRYITGQITGPEQQDLIHLLEQEEYRLRFEKVLQQNWEDGTYEETANQQIGALIEKNVLSRIQSPAVIHKLPFFKRYRIAAAAAILILIAGSYFVFFDSHRKNNILASLPKKQDHDANPGKYKAKLTLSDGSAIVLDSAAWGELAEQGNTKILNANGQLVYDGSHPAGPNAQLIYNTLSTGRGETYSTVLSDGSKVWLNSASSVKYPVSFSGNSRVIEITGEAYLEVAKVLDKEGPRNISFVVKTNGQEITVLGTHFNVNAYPDENSTRTTLLEGSVRVSSGVNHILIKPGEQSILEKGFTVKEVNVQDVVAWKNGFFSYKHADVKAIMRQISRWYDVDAVYDGINPDQTFTGKIDRSLPLSEVLKILEQTKIHFRIEGKKLIILP